MKRHHESDTFLYFLEVAVHCRVIGIARIWDDSYQWFFKVVSHFTVKNLMTCCRSIFLKSVDICPLNWFFFLCNFFFLFGFCFRSFCWMLVICMHLLDCFVLFFRCLSLSLESFEFCRSVSRRARVRVCALACGSWTAQQIWAHLNIHIDVY